MFSRLRFALDEDRAQDGFEYLLATGVVMVALAIGLFAFREMIPGFVGNTCQSVDTASSPPSSDGSCVVMEP
jgi:hypothetical protein